MLDNEPGGGEPTGVEPAATSADDSTPGARRTRAPRRRVTSTGAADAAPPVAGSEAEAPAGGAGLTGEPAAKAPARRRRKATTAAAGSDESIRSAAGTATAETATSAADTVVPATGTTGVPPDPAAPVKATRSRRRKADTQDPTDQPAAAAPPAAAVVPDAEESPPARETTRGRRRAPLPAVVFMPPEETAVEPKPARSRRTAKSSPAPIGEPAETPSAEVPAEETPAAETGRRRRRSGRGAEAVEPVTEPAEITAVAEDDEDDDAGARRRRRGRRGRGRGRGSAEDGEEVEETEEPAAVEADEDGDEDGLTRRRRRRRRKGAGDGDAEAEDGVHTVVRIREPRRVSDEVQGVTGSTRLEAKRQRRRDGREQRRTRPPILSESEFLARREAVDRVMVVRQRGDRTQIAVLEDGVLVEHYVTRASAGTMAGNVYLGKVQNVLPSMEAAFVDVGRGRNAVLYAGEVNWDATGLEGRARSIEQALKSGDPVLVQVTKDPMGHKGARLTSHIALSGRHLVYVPHGNASGISRKLADNERKRLRDVLKTLVPDGAGVIVRTAAEGASEDELARDVKRLQAQWEDIQAKAADGGAPVLLYEEPDLIIRVVRDLFNEDFRDLVVQGDDAFAEVEAYLSHVSPDLVPRLHRHTGVGDVFADKRIDEQILKGLDRKVFLPSGGHLVIDRTEAMTVVDVNTGKYTGAGGNLEETVTRNNLEAAEEIVRQLRLRDIGGIVVIDFIDMVLESNRDLVLRRLTECLGRDRTKHQVTEITSLGLVQMTRKRIGAGLLEAFSETCEACRGRGLIMHTEPVPDRPRVGAGAAEKVRAVASASTTPAEAPATGRRRGRRAAAEVPVAQDPALPEPAEAELPPAVGRRGAGARSVVPDVDADETMGYDLSRYGEPPELDIVPGAVGEDDLAPVDEDPDEETAGLAASRRRSRRGGTRRRTRP